MKCGSNVYKGIAILLACAAQCGLPATLAEGWAKYVGADYSGALRAYTQVLRSDPENLEAIYGIINAETCLHHYGVAQDWCDSLANRNVPGDIVRLKRDWIRSVRSQNHLYGVSVLGGPMFFSQDLIGAGPGRYGFAGGDVTGGEAWFTLNLRQSFSVGFSQLRGRFQESHPDSLYYGVKYTDTLYASLGQAPQTGKYIQGNFTNNLGNADTWYSDYVDTPLGELKARPDSIGYDHLVALAQAPYRPKAIYQRQLRLAWSDLFPAWSLGLALILGRSNVDGESEYYGAWSKQGFSNRWFDFVSEESVLKLEQAVFCQGSGRFIRALNGLPGLSGVLLEAKPVWIQEIATDARLPEPDRQLSLEAKMSTERRLWFASGNGAWGRHAYAVSLEGRSVERGDAPHRQSYGATVGWKPFGSERLRIYGIYAWEQYSSFDRQLLFAGAASQW